MAWMKRDAFVVGVDRGNCCSVCGGDARQDPRQPDGVREPVFTTGTLIDFEGLFTICESCCKELAHMLGWVSAEKAKEYIEKNRVLGQENQRLRKETAALAAVRSVLQG